MSLNTYIHLFMFMLYILTSYKGFKDYQNSAAKETSNPMRTKFMFSVFVTCLSSLFLISESLSLLPFDNRLDGNFLGGTALLWDPFIDPLQPDFSLWALLHALQAGRREKQTESHQDVSGRGFKLVLRRFCYPWTLFRSLQHCCNESGHDWQLQPCACGTLYHWEVDHLSAFGDWDPKSEDYISAKENQTTSFNAHRLFESTNTCLHCAYSWVVQVVKRKWCSTGKRIS